MRCDRVDFEPGGIAYRHTHPGPGHPLPALRRDHHRLAGRRAHPGPGRGVVRARARPGAGHDGGRRALGLRTRHAAARGVGRPAHDQVRRPRRRGQAQDPARDDLPRAAGAAVDAQRRAGPGRPARAARGRPGLRRPRRELPRRPRRAARRAAAPRRHPPRERRGEHGRGLRQAHRPPRRVHGHARAGGDQRLQRRAHRDAGLDAAAAARRADRPRDDRARGLPGARLPRRLRLDGQVGDADRPRRARAGAHRPRLRGGHVGPARAGRRRAAGGHARVRGRRARRRAAPAARRPRSAEGDMARLGELLAQARAPLAIVGEGGWTAQTGADVAAFAEAQALPVAASFRCQDYVDNASPAYAGHAGLAHGPGAGQAHPRGRPAAGHRRAPGRDPDRRLHARAPRRADPAPGPRAPRPRRDRRRVPDRAGDRRRPRGLRRRRPRARAVGRRRARRAARGGARRVRAQPRRGARAARAAADVGGDGDAARAPARRGDPHQRRRQLQRVGAPLLRVPPLPDAAGPAQRLDGLRGPGRGRPRRPCTPTARSSASPATATS